MVVAMEAERVVQAVGNFRHTEKTTARLVRWLPVLLVVVSLASITVPQRASGQQGAKTQPGGKAQAQAKTKMEPKTQAQAKTKAEAKTEAQTKTKTEAKTQPATKAQPGASDQPAANTQPIQIESVHVFETAGTPGGEGSYYMEITGHSLPTDTPAVFLAQRLAWIYPWRL